MRYIYFAILFLFTFSSFCQVQHTYKKPISLQLGFDPGKLFFSSLSKVKKAEIELAIQFPRLMLITQLGYYNKNTTYQLYDIFIDGYYFRVGAFYMISHESYIYDNLALDNSTQIGFGILFCNSFYQDKGFYTIRGPIWGDRKATIERKDWYLPSVEFSFIVQKDFADYFYIKSNIGVRHSPSSYREYTRFPESTWAIPGFARGGLVFNFTLGIKFPLNKER